MSPSEIADYVQARDERQEREQRGLWLRNENERRKLWRNAAVAASANYLTLDQPAKLADAVLAAYDRKFLGREPEPTEKVTEAATMDPVDVIRDAFGG